ncbi:hypothetical protein B0H67DRAFT_292744 [Lasiosphaeris hirsuta]|uniref:Uncharacterized protein n=1 Tax=Lasiosphaeris hirsuta TaxID=260670 RepID=A0AA40A919_9PEZI|nr:hypothetical protein B0H67DRAFT_292744 [Lasiosphaeris hirsuta]
MGWISATAAQIGDMISTHIKVSPAGLCMTPRWFIYVWDQGGRGIKRSGGFLCACVHGPVEAAIQSAFYMRDREQERIRDRNQRRPASGTGHCRAYYLPCLKRMKVVGCLIFWSLVLDVCFLWRLTISHVGWYYLCRVLWLRGRILTTFLRTLRLVQTTINMHNYEQPQILFQYKYMYWFDKMNTKFWGDTTPFSHYANNAKYINK